MAQRLGSVIKSASRALQILELFNQPEAPTTVMEVARSLNYPQSSTSYLLRCLVAEGYLAVDSSARTYSASARLALLGSWAGSRLFRHGAVLRLLDDLAERSAETAILATRSGLALRHIQLAGSKIPPHLATGTLHPVMKSALGQALLSTTHPTLVSKLVHRFNADKQPGTAWVSASDFLATLATVRAQGYAVSDCEGDYSMIGVLLPECGSETLALGVAAKGPLGVIRTAQLVRELRQAVAVHIGPTVSSNPVSCRTAPALRLPPAGYRHAV